MPITLGLFGYVPTDPRLKRVLEGGLYNLSWIFPRNEQVAAITSLRVQPPEVLVVNPVLRSAMEGYKGLLPTGTELVMRAQPFGSDHIHPPLSVDLR